MNILMMPALPENTSAVVNDAVGQVSEIGGESFTSYLEKSQEMANSKNESLLGVANPKDAKHQLDNRIAELIEGEDITTVPGLLEHMMLLLQGQAEEIENGAGDWIFSMPDSGLLEKLALAAGMTEEEVSQFLQTFPTTGGEDLTLASLLDNLAEHFSQVTNDTPILVPDTEFPLFAALLSKMGMTMDQVEDISEQVINGLDQLDLGLLTDVLSKLTLENQMPGQLQGQMQGKNPNEFFAPVQLRGWETEQLTSILQQMGLTEEDLRNLPIPLPKKNSTLDLPKLVEFLSNAVDFVKNSQPQPDALTFLDRLGQLFNEAGFKEQTTGFTPVVQHSIESIYKKLMETVDLSKVRIQVADVVQKPQTEVPSVAGMIMEEGQLDGEELFISTADEGEQSSKLPEGKINLAAMAEASIEDNKQNPVTIKFDATTVTVSADAISPQDVSVQELKEPMAMPRTAQTMTQQTINQLSQAVASGANRNEHHLIIRLYPEDLGEVKVNLHVRDEQVSVSFTMENSRVKNILESNMQDFKNSLEKQGFNLGDFSASVDKQDQGNSEWQNFNEFAKERFWNVPKENLTDLPEDIMYRRPVWMFPESVIDLRV